MTKHIAPDAGQVPDTPSRTNNKEGHTRKHVFIKNDAWDKLQAHVDAKDLDLDRFLTRLMSNAAANLE